MIDRRYLWAPYAHKKTCGHHFRQEFVFIYTFIRVQSSSTTTVGMVERGKVVIFQQRRRGSHLHAQRTGNRLPCPSCRAWIPKISCLPSTCPSGPEHVVMVMQQHTFFQNFQNLEMTLASRYHTKEVSGLLLLLWY